MVNWEHDIPVQEECSWDDFHLNIMQLRAVDVSPEAYLEILFSLMTCLESAQKEMGGRLFEHRKATEDAVQVLCQ